MKDVCFAFDHNTEGIRSGQAVAYRPTPGDVIYDMYLDPKEFWDGENSLIDVGLFLSGRPGLFQSFGLTFGPTSNLHDYFPTGDGAGLGVEVMGSGSTKTMRVASGGLGPIRCVTSDPICVCVSQDGTPNGDDPGCTTGAAEIHFLVIEAGEQQ